jgi:hypothetical protein
MSGVMLNRAGADAPAPEPAPQMPQADPMQMIRFMIQHLTATIQQVSTSLGQIAEAVQRQQGEIADLQAKMSAPKEILRDHTGRAVGTRLAI